MKPSVIKENRLWYVQLDGDFVDGERSGYKFKADAIRRAKQLASERSKFKTYWVKITRIHTYEVEANDEEGAKDRYFDYGEGLEIENEIRNVEAVLAPRKKGVRK